MLLAGIRSCRFRCHFRSVNYDCCFHNFIFSGNGVVKSLLNIIQTVFIGNDLFNRTIRTCGFYTSWKNVPVAEDRPDLNLIVHDGIDVKGDDILGRHTQQNNNTAPSGQFSGLTNRCGIADGLNNNARAAVGKLIYFPVEFFFICPFRFACL